jgi:hypothetical protein
MISDWVWDFVQVGSAHGRDDRSSDHETEANQKSEINLNSELTNLKSHRESSALDDEHSGEHRGGSDDSARVEWLTEHEGPESHRNHRVYVRIK